MKKLSLEERIDRLESIEAIKRLKHEYCKACDDNYNPQAIAALFAPDGFGDYADNDKPQGPAAIAEKFKETHKRILFAAHLVMNAIIEVEGDKGHGTWWILQPQTRMVDGKPVGHWMLGKYDEDFVRINGEWKFKRLHVRAKFTTPILEDWAKSSLGLA